MNKTIGIRSESKTLREKRAPITPYFAEKIMSHNNFRIVAQHSPQRAFKDVEYEHCGVDMVNSLSGCDVIFGIKEIPENEIEANKTYVFFSHTHKGQSYNMPMLRTLIQNKCTLIDYECIKDERGHRLIAFGYHAGLAGMINTLWALGKRYEQQNIETPFIRMKQAVEYKSMITARHEVHTIGELIATKGLPPEITPLTVGIVGRGRVSKGAQAIMNLLPICEITPAELLRLKKKRRYSNKVIYKVVFHEHDIAAPVEKGNDFSIKEYYKQGEKFQNIFETYVPYLSVVVNGIYWEKNMPRLITSDYIEQLYAGQELPKLTVIGDITCDPGGSIEFMHKPTDIEHPVFVYNPKTRESAIGLDGDGIAVMAVDILPSELPRDASNSFAELLEEYIPPIALADYTKPLEDMDLPASLKKAVIVLAGNLTPDYLYLQKHLEGHHLHTTLHSVIHSINQMLHRTLSAVKKTAAN